jgi:hypothetical protein
MLSSNADDTRRVCALYRSEPKCCRMTSSHQIPDLVSDYSASTLYPTMSAPELTLKRIIHAGNGYSTPSSSFELKRPPYLVSRAKGLDSIYSCLAVILLFKLVIGLGPFSGGSNRALRLAL